ILKLAKAIRKKRSAAATLEPRAVCRRTVKVGEAHAPARFKASVRRRAEHDIKVVIASQTRGGLLSVTDTRRRGREGNCHQQESLKDWSEHDLILLHHGRRR